MGGIMKKEYWKPVVGYEGLYEVSNWGRVKSLKRLVKSPRGYRTVCERTLKPTKDSHGYLCVSLHKEGKMKFVKIHRLVAEAFIDNPDNLPCVNHKDENPLNNVVSNLEWCTYSYNNSYGTRLERVRDKQINGKKSKPVFQYDLEGNFIKEWESAAECGRNGFHQAHIIDCCKGKYKQHKGFIWRYK